jgi:S-adenosylmethionine:tRNA ribosyltransferase-isomerase
MLNINDFDYELPEQLIARNPTSIRDESKLLTIDDQGVYHDQLFNQIIDYVAPNDLIVFNNTKVIPARLFANKISGGHIELLIERILPNNNLLTHIRSNKKITLGLEIYLPAKVIVKVVKHHRDIFEVALISKLDDWISYLHTNGHIPLPPYIKRIDTDYDKHRYQTIYAQHLGSVAAPTAGLHFSDELMSKLHKLCDIAYITLHIGAGTFKSVSSYYIKDHKMHSEIYSVSQQTIDQIKLCKANSGKIIAVGTTTLRTLETIWLSDFGRLQGETDIFITPGFEFKVVDKLITNFHLPKSTLLMLVSAFAGMNVIRDAYQYAIKNQYRFFSYGDAMLLNKS